jgi:hypothetical protein
MTEAQDSVDFIVRILFGRYRSWGALGWEHLIIMGAVVLAMVNAYVWVFRKRFMQYKMERERVPRRVLPIERQDMPKQLYASLVDEVIRVERVTAANLTPEKGPTEQCGDIGWGRDGTDVEGVNFKTYIAKSYLVLEQTALSRRPGMFHRDARDTRTYVARLQKAFPDLPPPLCCEYLRAYELAVFSDHCFSFAEYERFMRVLVALVSIIHV